MKARLLKWLSGWLYNITAEQWTEVLTWCARLLKHKTLTGEQKRAEVIRAFRAKWLDKNLGSSALNWLIETAVGLAKKRGGAS